MNDQSNDHSWHDAILDRGLGELVGGQSPPDLTERILAAARATTTEPVTLTEGTPTMSTATVKQSSRLKSWALLAASLACIATVIGLSPVARQLSVPDQLAKREVSNNLKELRTNFSSSGTDDGDNVMMETPKIIIQEKEETRLGLAEEESSPLDLPPTDPVTVTDSVSVPDGGTVLLGGLKRKPSSEGTGQTSAPISGEKLASAVKEFSEHRDSQRYSEMEQVAHDLYQQAPDHPVAQQVWENAKFIRRKMLNRELSNHAEGGVAVVKSLSQGEQASASTSGIEIDERNFDSSGPYSGEVEGDASYFSMGFPARNSGPRSYMGLQGLINDGYGGEHGTGTGTSGDQYTRIHENPFIVAQGPDAVSTFSIDVDTASYANVRQFLISGQLPPPDAVRIEELINYFHYDYAAPTDETPFAAHMEIAACPWNAEHRLARIAIKGKEIDRQARPQSNLVFLIDVSGSMNEPNKLPLLVEGMKLLTRELGENDRVAIVVYASSEGLALASTRGDQQQTILAALNNLRAGGSTAGGAGINLAYQIATDNFITGGVNRVILCTDGDFNVGVTSTADLERLAEQKARDTKVFLTVLGFGRGNLNDAMMEAISGRGNGNYHYIDNLTEARKVLVEEMSGTLVTIAKDVKIQVEFNPAQVAGYRLIGYENRLLRTEDFNDDKKDAGEIGAGHTVTALYEIIPAGQEVGVPATDPLKYQQPPLAGLADDTAKPQAVSDELLTLKLRYKLPEADTSTKLEFPITDVGSSFADATDDFQFTAAVASFGMLLRDSEHKGNATFDAVLEIAQAAVGSDPHGYRGEFLELVRRAKQLSQPGNSYEK